MDIVWYGAPSSFQIVPTYGDITQEHTQFGIPFLTLSGTVAGSPAAIEFDADALDFLILSFDSVPPQPFVFPGLTFTSLTASASSAPEPGTVALTALGLFGLFLAQRWSIRRNRLA
jgi:hypothetical protein